MSPSKSLQDTLLNRSKSKCELCSTSISTSSQHFYSVPPIPPAKMEQSSDRTILLCEECLNIIEKGASDKKVSELRFLNDSIWSEIPAVVVISWRILKKLGHEVSWAADLLGQIYLDDENLKWAESDELNNSQEGASEGSVTPTRDSNGNLLSDGDTVTLIKDLEVKGAGFTAKRGTIVRKISLTDNPLHVEGKVNGVQIVLVASFLKKS